MLIRFLQQSFHSRTKTIVIVLIIMSVGYTLYLLVSQLFLVVPHGLRGDFSFTVKEPGMSTKTNIYLSAIADSDGCGTFSKIKFQSTHKDRTLYVKVKGFSFIDTSEGSTCTQAVRETHAKIPIDLSVVDTVIFSLRGVDNRYRVVQFDGNYYLEPVKVSNVVILPGSIGGQRFFNSVGYYGWSDEIDGDDFVNAYHRHRLFHLGRDEQYQLADLIVPDTLGGEMMHDEVPVGIASLVSGHVLLDAEGRYIGGVLDTEGRYIGRYLVFTKYAGRDCDDLTDITYTSEQKGRSLRFVIHGYRHTPFITESADDVETPCGYGYGETKMIVLLPYDLSTLDEIVFSLGGKENRYRVAHYQGLYSLVPTEAPNVFVFPSYIHKGVSFFIQYTGSFYDAYDLLSKRSFMDDYLEFAGDDNPFH